MKFRCTAILQQYHLTGFRVYEYAMGRAQSIVELRMVFATTRTLDESLRAGVFRYRCPPKYLGI